MLGLIIFYELMGIAMIAYIIKKDVVSTTIDLIEDYITINKIGIGLLWFILYICMLICWPFMLLLGWFGIDN